MNTMRVCASLLALTALAGCSTVVTAPGPPAPDIVAPPASNLPPPPAELPPDPVPRSEPRSRYGNPASYEVFGRRYFVLTESQGFRERGVASWYGPGFHGERTSSGEPYDMYGMTAAHKTLPLPAYVRVENLSNGHSVVVRVNDRGPFVGDRIIDLSYAAAAKLDMLRGGTALVEIEVIQPSLAAVSTTASTALPLPSPNVDTSSAAPAAPPSATLPPSSPVAVRFVQAGAFALRTNAERLANKLRSAGFLGVDIRSGSSSKGPLHRVWLGPIANASEADDLIERLALSGVPDARLAHADVAALN